ncbi:reverse transcriptase domain-containing protein, partial [Tanacetum coccineum]
ELIAQGVASALAEIEANQSRNGDDSHDSGTGVRRPVQVARECTYPDFLKCKPLNFFKRHMRIVVGTLFTQLVRKRISCSCNAMENIEKDDTDKYCPRGEIKKLEFEMWNLKVKGTDVVTYNQRFQELALMCHRMFPEEANKIEKYVDAIEFETELMDKKISTFAERQAENKRKLDNNNQAQQQFPKRQNVAQAYTVGSGERKEYAGTLPLFNKCKFHHNGQFTIKCANCKRVGHLTRDCRSPAATNNQRNLTCYGFGNQRHYKSDCS